MPARRCVHLGPWGLPARTGLAKAAAAGAEGVEIVGAGELAPIHTLPRPMAAPVASRFNGATTTGEAWKSAIDEAAINTPSGRYQPASEGAK